MMTSLLEGKMEGLCAVLAKQGDELWLGGGSGIESHKMIAVKFTLNKLIFLG